MPTPEPTPTSPEAVPASAPAESTPEERAIARLTHAQPAAQPAEEPAPQAQPEGDEDNPRVAKLYGQMARNEQKLRETERERRELAQRLEALERREKEWEEDPYTAAERRGLNAQEWAARKLGLDLEQEPDPSETALKKVAELEAREKQREEREQQLHEQTRHAELRGHVATFLEENDFPGLRASPVAVERLVQQVRKMEQGGDFAGMAPDDITGTIRQMASDLSGALRGEVLRYLQSPGELKALLQDETLSKAAREVLALGGQPPAGKPSDAERTGNEPRTITDRLASEPGSRQAESPSHEGMSPFERERAATAALERAFAKRRAAV